MTIYALSGLPATGKSTFASNWVERLNTVYFDVKYKYVSSDIVRKNMFMNPTYTKEENIEVFRNVKRIINGYKRLVPIIYDASNCTTQAWDFVKGFGVDITPIWFTAPYDTIVSRMKLRKINTDSLGGSDADMEVYHKMADPEYHIKPPFEEYYVVDSDMPDTYYWVMNLVSVQIEADFKRLSRPH